MKAVAAVLAVVAALATVIGVGELSGPSDRVAQAARPAAPARVPVIGSTAVCPDVRSVPGVLTSRVSIGSASADPADAPSELEAVEPGTLTSAPVSAPGAPAPLPLTRTGQAVSTVVRDLDDDALELTATGRFAPGLEVEQVTRGSTGSSRGLASMRCEAAATDQWFVGGSTRPGEATVLTLVNPDVGPALVDLTLFGAAGPVDSRPGRGLVVPARARLQVSINELAPDRSLLTLRVSTTRGRVASSVLTTRADGRVPKGIDFLPPAGPPAERVVLPGLPQGPGARTLLLSNPGSEPATASVELATTDGQIIDESIAAVAVPPTTTVAVELSDLLADEAGAISVRSPGRPLLAAALVADPGSQQVADFSLVGSSAPLTAPALLSDVTIAEGIESTLLLSALDGDATVVVTALPVQGSSGAVAAPMTVAVPGGSTRLLGLSSLLPTGAGRVSVEVRPQAGSGPVHASRYLREDGARGPLTTMLALRSAAGLVPAPRVGADPAAGRLAPG